MPLPERVEVKLSSEAAGAVALTQVVVRDMELRELLELALEGVGRDAARVCDLMKRGSLVSGASRFRWKALECGLEEMERALAVLPGPEPARAFDAERCTRIALLGPRTRIEMAREAALQRRWFKTRSFWDALVDAAAPAAYAGYSYTERADRYVSVVEDRRIKEGASLLRFEGLALQIRRGHVDRVEWTAPR